MSASAEPAVDIRCVMSVLIDVVESIEDLWECEVAEDIVEMAESIDEVRGIDLRSGRIAPLAKGVDAVRTGDAGGELPRDLDNGTGEEMLRSW